jgi:predicted PurR-regulated permease PerM
MKEVIIKPEYLKILQYVVFGSIIMYFGSSVLIPLAYAVFISFILYPVAAWLEKRRFPRGLAIATGLLLLLVIISGILALLISQAIGFAKQWPQLDSRLSIFFTACGNWLLHHTSISPQRLNQWVENSLDTLGSKIMPFMGSTLYFSAVSAVKLVLIPVYVWLILYNRERLLTFFYRFFPESKKAGIKIILHEVIFTFYRFIKGMLTVYIIVGTLNSIGLYFLGVPDAILFGFIASILTFIPYIGIIIGSLLPVTIAWAVHDNFWYGIGVIAVFTFVQVLEANVIFPLAVSYRLKVGTLFTILAIFSGAVLWGVSGMILFIPALGILKLILEKIPGYEPAAKLLE